MKHFVFCWNKMRTMDLRESFPHIEAKENTLFENCSETYKRGFAF